MKLSKYTKIGAVLTEDCSDHRTNTITYTDMTSTEMTAYGIRLVFDGTNYMDTNERQDFIQQTGVFTINFNVKLDNATANYDVMDTGTGVIPPDGWRVNFLNGFLYFSISNGAAEIVNQPFSTASATLTEWNTFTLVGDGSNVTIYVNGVAGDSFAMTTGNFGGTQELTTTISGSEYPLAGLISDVVIFDRTLSASEIEDYYYFTTFNYPLDTYSEWKLDDSTELLDSSWKKDVGDVAFMGTSATLNFDDTVDPFANASATMTISTQSSFGKLLHATNAVVSSHWAGNFESGGTERVDQSMGTNVTYTVDDVLLVSPNSGDLYTAIADGNDHVVTIGNLDLNHTRTFTHTYDGTTPVSASSVVRSGSNLVYNSRACACYDGFMYVLSANNVRKLDIITGGIIENVSVSTGGYGFATDGTYFYIGDTTQIIKHTMDGTYDSVFETGARTDNLYYYDGYIYGMAYSAGAGTPIYKWDINTGIREDSGMIVQNGGLFGLIMFEDYYIEVLSGATLRAWDRTSLLSNYLWEKTETRSYMTGGSFDDVNNRIHLITWDRDWYEHDMSFASDTDLRVYKESQYEEWSGTSLPTTNNGNMYFRSDWDCIARNHIDGYIYGVRNDTGVMICCTASGEHYRVITALDNTSQIRGITFSDTNFFVSRIDGTITKYNLDYTNPVLIGTTPVSWGLAYKDGYLYTMDDDGYDYFKVDESDGIYDTITLSIRTFNCRGICIVGNTLITTDYDFSSAVTGFDLDTGVRDWYKSYNESSSKGIVYEPDLNRLIVFRSETKSAELFNTNQSLKSQTGTSGLTLKGLDIEWGDGTSYVSDCTVESDFINQSGNPYAEVTVSNITYNTVGFGSDIELDGMTATPSFNTEFAKDAIELDGLGSATTIQTIGQNLTGLSELSFTGWIKKSALDGSYGLISILETANIPKLEIVINATNQIQITLGTSSGTSTSILTDAVIFNTEWHHIAVTINLTDDKVELYVDGTYVNEYAGTGETSFDSTYNSSSFVFSDSTGTQQFTGSVSDFRLYSVALTQSQIIDLIDGKTEDVDPVYVAIPWDLDVADLIEGTQKDLTGSSPFTSMSQVSMNNDGTMLYVDTLNDNIIQYSLSTPFNMTTTSLVHNETPNYDNSYSKGLFIRRDGLMLWSMSGSTTTSVRIYEHTFGTAWDLTTMSAGVIRNLPNPTANFPSGCFFSPDGTNFYHHFRQSNSNTRWYTLSTPWDLTTASLAGEYASGVEDGQHVFSNDGTRMITRPSNLGLRQYVMTTPWDITTITGIESTISRPWNMSGMYMDEYNSKFIVMNSGDVVTEWTFV